MIKNNLMVLLAEKDLSLKALADEAGLRYATLWAFAKNRTQSADYKMLDKLCKTLRCGPGDILRYIPPLMEEV